MSDSSSSPSASSILYSTSTLYDVLGVSENADKTEIAKKYRQLSIKFHPDRLPDEVKQNQQLADESKRALQLVQDAYKTLTDDEKRTTYDFARRVGASPATQEQLNQLHTMMATMFFKSSSSSSTSASSTNSSSSSTIASSAERRKCSCGKPLDNPDDLLCSSCGMFKPKGRCKQMGCLNNIPNENKSGNGITGSSSSSSSMNRPRTQQTAGMCDKCAFRRKCGEWGCMKKVDAADRDVCLYHFENPSADPGRPAKYAFESDIAKFLGSDHKSIGGGNDGSNSPVVLTPGELVQMRMKLAELVYQEQLARSGLQLEAMEIAIKLHIKSLQY